MARSEKGILVSHEDREDYGDYRCPGCGAQDCWASCSPRCAAVQGDHPLGAGKADYSVVRKILRNSWGWTTPSSKDGPRA